MLIAEGLRAIASLMGNRAAAIPSGDRLLGGMARLGITTPRLETLLATLVDPDPVEKLANLIKLRRRPKHLRRPGLGHGSTTGPHRCKSCVA